jgi:cephalosporin hydroxylase
MKKKTKEIEAIRAINKAVFAQRGPAKRGSWRGVRAVKYPTDLLLYAEIMFDQRIDLVVETGTRYGGSALFLADVCKCNNHGKVATIEINQEYETPKHLRLVALKGSSTDPEIVQQVFALKKETALVILDSDHSPAHVEAELNAYAPLVHVGGYIVVEDLHQEGAARVVDRFLKLNKNFVRDINIEKYGIHSAREGFLRRVA